MRYSVLSVKLSLKYLHLQVKSWWLTINVRDNGNSGWQKILQVFNVTTSFPTKCLGVGENFDVEPLGQTKLWRCSITDKPWPMQQLLDAVLTFFVSEFSYWRAQIRVSKDQHPFFVLGYVVCWLLFSTKTYKIFYNIYIVYIFLKNNEILLLITCICIFLILKFVLPLPIRSCLNRLQQQQI